MSKPIITVVGGTGARGGGVVDALLERGRFAVRVITRHPESDKGTALAGRGVEVVPADLNDASTLPAAFDGSYGVFLQLLGPGNQRALRAGDRDYGSGSGWP